MPLNPGSAESHHMAALAWLAKGDGAKALLHARRATSMAVYPVAEYMVTLGDTLSATGQTSEAKQAWRIAAEAQGPRSIYAAAVAGKLQPAPVGR